MLLSRIHALYIAFFFLSAVFISGCTLGNFGSFAEEKSKNSSQNQPQSQNISITIAVVDNASKNSSNPANFSISYNLSNLSASLLEINNIFLNQTQQAEEAAARMDFYNASKLFNLSSNSAANLTGLLSIMCKERKRDCSAQLAAYRQISECAFERGVFYAQLNLLLDALGGALECARAYNSTSDYSSDCIEYKNRYELGCSSLLSQAQRTFIACHEVMPNINVIESANLICNQATNSSG